MIWTSRLTSILCFFKEVNLKKYSVKIFNLLNHVCKSFLDLSAGTIQTNFLMKVLQAYLVYLSLLTSSLCVRMKLTLAPEQQRCFYQLLTTQQKYAVEIVPYTGAGYVLDIRHHQNNEWLHSVTRRVDTPFENVTLNKLASKEALYSFCLSNSATEKLVARVGLRWGLELLDLQVLAEESDQESLERQAKWIDKQADKIIEIINNSKNQIASKEELQGLMSDKLISFAVVGVLTVAAINVYFYLSIRTTFRERKMI